MSVFDRIRIARRNHARRTLDELRVPRSVARPKKRGPKPRQPQQGSARP